LPDPDSAEAALAFFGQNADHLKRRFTDADALAERFGFTEQFPTHGFTDQDHLIAGFIIGIFKTGAMRDIPSVDGKIVRFKPLPAG
jgi:hypothetical protein